MMIREKNYNYKKMTTMATKTCSHRSMVTSLINGFLKFLTRFSGRRRSSNWPHHQHKHCLNSASSHYIDNFRLSLIVPVVLLLVLSTIIDVTDACNSRSVPRPRTTPAPQAPTTTTTTPRPSITFPTNNCAPDYAQWYCLNGATCFTVTIGKEVLYNCECPDGYIGPRCDYKNLDGSYLAGRPRVMLETASIAGGAFAAIFLAFVVGFFVYVRWHQTKKRELNEEDALQSPQNGQTNGHHNAAADVVDGVVELCNCQQSQIQFSSQLGSNTTNGDGGDLQHPQQNQFHVVPHHHHHPPPRRPFGPHHYHPVSMGEMIDRR